MTRFGPIGTTGVTEVPKCSSLWRVIGFGGTLIQG
jgi:hypothetical protein